MGPTRATAVLAVVGGVCLGVLGDGPGALAGPSREMPWAIGGVGGAYLLAEPGRLEVEVFKRDLNVSSVRTDVRVILAAPDREVVADTTLAHAGGWAGDPPGLVESVRLEAEVERPGVFALAVTTRGDRYGSNVAWGLRTNARGLVVETARGHRDERHEEPIVLLDAERPAEVCFLPRPGAFEIEVEGLPEGVGELELLDDGGAVAERLEVVAERSTRIRDYLRLAADPGPEGVVRHAVPADEARGSAPWCLRFPRGRAYVSIDGVTRWQTGDRYADQAVWSPERRSWFGFQASRWLVSPYERTVFARPGEAGTVAFRVHNNAPVERSLTLGLTCPGSADADGEARRAAWLPRVEGGRSGGWLASAWRHRAGADRTARPGPDASARGPKGPAAPGQPGGRPVAELSRDSLTLAAGQSVEVEVAYALPESGAGLVCHLRAVPSDDPALETYATLRVRAGRAPAGQALELPLVLRPWAHENRQLGYLPDYPVDNQMYFDLRDRPYVVTSRHLFRGTADGWVATEIGRAVTRRVPDFAASGWSTVTTKVAFDADNDLYLLARSGTTVALLHSVDGGQTFVAYALMGAQEASRSWDIEASSGQAAPAGPPPVVRLTRTVAGQEGSLRWRSVNDLDLFLAAKRPDGGLEIADPLRVSDRSLGLSMHSGIPATIASRAARVHVVWAEATDPAAPLDEVPGVPTYIATFDRDTARLGRPVLLGFGPPPNDGHNTPSVTIDGAGVLHVVVGAHGRPLQYVRSLAANDAYGGWSEPARTAEAELSQTYVGLVSGLDGTLHLVYRQWRSGEAHLGGATWAALAYQRKRPGGAWEPPRVLVAPPLPEYSIYYHRLTVDREGALYVSYDYWSTMWFYRNDARGAVSAGSGRPGAGWGRALLCSTDGGTTWSLR